GRTPASVGVAAVGTKRCANAGVPPVSDGVAAVGIRIGPVMIVGVPPVSEPAAAVGNTRLLLD
ncbi:hypothetical protein RA985_21620, partial [Mycobacteroides abscessus subsp. abscessus]